MHERKLSNKRDGRWNAQFTGKDKTLNGKGSGRISRAAVVSEWKGAISTIVPLEAPLLQENQPVFYIAHRTSACVAITLRGKNISNVKD